MKRLERSEERGGVGLVVYEGLWCCSRRQTGWCRFRRSSPDCTSMGRAVKRVMIGRGAYYGKDPRQKSGLLDVSQVERRQIIRPHLTALLWHNSEAQLIVVELEPDIFA